MNSIWGSRTSRFKKWCSKGTEAGFGLVEALLGGAIAVGVVAGVSTMIVNSKKSAKHIESTVEISNQSALIQSVLNDPTLCAPRFYRIQQG